MKTKLLIFGITGDLGRRKLLPALEEIVDTGRFDDLSIIGVSRRVIEKFDLIQSCKIGSAFCQRISIYSMNMSDGLAYENLKKHIDLKSDEQLIIYLSVPPDASSGIVENLGQAGINGDNVKILFEKPFGVDLQSAQEVISHASRYYKEQQIYRIDHYLAKEMAQNLIAFRAHNPLFGQVWNRDFIESIEITAAEKIGIENRVELYEQTGALRDVIQGHLMQLLALTLMDTPQNLDWERLPELRFAALNDILPANPNDSSRGQYDGYKQEVSRDSFVETFASVKLYSSSEKWQGVPLTIKSGKAMSEKKTEIRIRLKNSGDLCGNDLVFRIQPNEGIDIELFTKKPGYSLEFEKRNLSLNYQSNESLPDAYEQVLVDAISSQKSLFTSSDEVLRSWEILAPIQNAWGGNGDCMKTYGKNSDIDTI